MKPVIIIMVAIAVLLGAVFWTNLRRADDASQLSYETITTDVDSGAKLLDVRTPSEYAAGHADVAELWPLQALEKGELPDVDPATKLYVYCRSGNRSSQATKILRDNGYRNVVDLGGLRDIEVLGASISK
ncbi:hypothetical protein CR983_01990 [Candidatus Saccharibacteria bacterium]|nr:MAG: hypothetical protein CR983_01990 [Candidatus Saccharibacteria bacterium]